ncbi:hypothetical protein V5799_030431 [Amblyomma americanum]|uniref:Uncharacterized protein n=1 Tax=Amblyomma americanum TaxID=6943 RepID=A0AAQ4ENA5_AMBAM
MDAAFSHRSAPVITLHSNRTDLTGPSNTGHTKRALFTGLVAGRLCIINTTLSEVGRHETRILGNDRGRHHDHFTRSNTEEPRAGGKNRKDIAIVAEVLSPLELDVMPQF